MKKKKGFTLIELLIVLVIIGVITTLAVPQYQSFVIRIRGAEAMTNVRAIADSVWRHYLEAGDFPTSSATGPIPKELDVEVSGSSKYFSYSYYYQTESGNEKVAIIATDKDVSLNNRFGNIVRYFILYAKNPAGFYGDYNYTLQKMDDTWYRGYFHAIWTAAGNEYKAGWPGSGNQ